jgi:hypothetical protein
MPHINTTWFAKAKEAHMLGMDHIYDYGIRYIRVHRDSFYAAKHHEVMPYDNKYMPNPFRFQYDLTMFIWINYYKILKEEIAILKKIHERDKKGGFGDLAESLILTNQLYGISRSDFLFAAGELRWPTVMDSAGAHYGLFIRDPWSERRVDAISDEHLKHVVMFGGGGQGKTHISLAVNLMIFDYYIFTQKGARCMISTVNKDKLNSVSWAYLCNLNSSTQPGISLYAGKAKIAGDHTLARPNNKDRGGVFKGILIGQSMNPQSIVDKLTGSHGHPFIAYIIDEAQSTPDPPITASPNYTMHARDFRISLAGNWGENNDTLALNCKPDIGWDNVDELTGRWVSTMQNGAKAIVLHFNNNLSPGMTEEGSKLYPHLPSKKILDAKYPDQSKRSMNNIAYRRFWVGFRVEEDGKLNVVTERLVKENLADLPLELDRVTHSFFSFDSAPAEIDRNLQTICREGICKHTKQRVFGPSHVCALTKTTESTKYYQESTNELLLNAQKNNIISGAAIVDWTGRPAHPEMLQQKNFLVQKVVYNKAVPDGVRRDAHTGRVERAIRLNVELDFKQDVPIEEVCAHHVAENMISLGAWALREYIKAGRVRGINSSLIKYLDGQRDLQEELYNRKFYLKNSTKYGSRFHLQSKDEFKKEYGFSPDLLDTLFQAALYMLLYRNLPLTPVTNGDIVLQQEEETEPEFQSHQELWEDDMFEVEFN